MGSVMSIADLKIRMRDVPGISGLTMQMLGGRQNFGINGHLVAVDAGASEVEAEKAIRAALASPAVAQMPAGTPIQASPSAALIPAVTTLAPAPAQPKAVSMTTPQSGGFATQIKAMIEDARAGIAKAQADGLAKVKDAVSKLDEAKTATANVATNMAATIESEASSVLAELGQISNLPPE